MTTAELLAALGRECPNGVSFDPMAVRLLRQKVRFEDWQIENLKAEMFQLGNGLWFSGEMISDDESRLTFLEQVTLWLEEHGCFSVERLFRDFCSVFRQIATPEDCAAFLRHLGFIVAVWGKCGYFCSQPPDFADCAGACNAITEHRKVKSVTPAAKAAAGKANGAAPTRSRGGTKLLLAFAESGAGKIEALLMRPEGASLEEMRAHRGAVESHLNSLRKAGFNIVRNNGRYYYVEPGDPMPGAAPTQEEQANEPPLNLDDSLAAISETIAGWLEEAGGMLTFHDIEQEMPYLTAEALEGIRAQFLPEVNMTTIGGVPCWCSTEAIHLPEDFSEKLTTVVDTLVVLNEKVSASKLEFALNLFYRIRLREEYALLDNDTFMRVCAKHYQGGNNIFPNEKFRIRANDLSVPGRRVRSPNTRLCNLGVPIGSEIAFTKDNHITCTVLDDSNQVEYDGKAWSISALATHLLGVSSANGFCHFSYEGEVLWDRRLRMEQADKKDEYQSEEMPSPTKVQEAESKIIGLEGRPLSPSTWRSFRADGTNPHVAVWARRVENGESVGQIARESGYALSTMKVMISNFHLYFKVCRLNGIVPEGDADV